MVKMNYELTEEQQAIVEIAKQIADEKILPIREEYDEGQIFPSEIVEILAKSDLYRVFVPEEYDGLGMGIFEMSLVTEELSRVCGGIALAYAGSALGAFPILLYGSEEQKKKFLPSIASGEKIAAFALTESEAGSDASNVRTTATKEGDHYILNGTKQWITNGGVAGVHSVFATVDPTRGIRGMTAFIVDSETDGLEIGKKENKLGIRASETVELIFNNCKIPAENLIGREGTGFRVAMGTFDQSRPGVAAQALGIAQGAMEAALSYAQERIQFGSKIYSFQAIRFMIADMAIKIEAARALIYNVSKLIDSGAKNTGGYSAMAKTFASDVAMEVTTDAVQVLGGYGYMKEYPVEKMMRDAKITQIFEGTNQIQREVIASHLAKELSRLRK